jgi:hypothetical protein
MCYGSINKVINIVPEAGMRPSGTNQPVTLVSSDSCPALSGERKGRKGWVRECTFCMPICWVLGLILKEQTPLV